jgi:hypothetical protein
MKYLIAAIISMAFAMSMPDQAAAQSERSQTSSQVAGRPSAVRVSKRPEFGVEISKVARFKVASRKTDYRLGEMITLDVAMLNVAATPVFFRDLQEPMRLEVLDERGTKVQVSEYLGFYLVLSADSYSLLNTNEMNIASYDVIAGCDNRVFENFNDQHEAPDDKVAFEQNQFVSFGRACLNLTRPGTYTITSIVNNEHVLAPSSGTSHKTAVGKITSLPLTITISEH